MRVFLKQIRKSIYSYRTNVEGHTIRADACFTDGLRRTELISYNPDDTVKSITEESVIRSVTGQDGEKHIIYESFSDPDGMQWEEFYDYTDEDYDNYTITEKNYTCGYALKRRITVKY